MNGPNFFVLEGIDGVGKSTHMERLTTWLRDLGHDVVTCRDPGSTPVGEALRQLLLDPVTELDACGEMLVYMAARSQLVSQIIRPALERGQTVLSDRYLLSNAVYQGHAGGLGLEPVWQVGGVATGGLYPDLTILLDLEVEQAIRRRGRTADRIERRGTDFLRQVRQGFLDLANRRAGTPFPVAIVDASPDAVSVQQCIRAAIQPYLKGGAP